MEATAPPPTLELFYGGRYFKGDSIRLCLTYAGIPFEDIRADHPKWSEFVAMKSANELPFGQQPVLRVGGATGILLGQSTAICRYIAKLADPAMQLYPSDPVSAAVVDGILMQDDDMRTGFYAFKYPARYGFEAALEAENADPSQPAPTRSARSEMVRQALLGTLIPKHLNYFEALLAKSSSGWLANTALPTIADFYMSQSFLALRDNLDAPAVLDRHPRILGLIEKVRDVYQFCSLSPPHHSASVPAVLSVPLAREIEPSGCARPGS